MSSVGSQMGAIISLKNNRKLRRSQRTEYKDPYKDTPMSKKKVDFIKLPPEELELVLQQIRKESRKQRKRRRVLFWSIIFVLVGSIWIFEII